MEDYQVNNYNKVKRGANRASYDKAIIHEILKASFMCHVAYVWEGRPIIIPTAYGNENNTIYIHGAIANRMMKGLVKEGKASLTVTHLDGLVLARSGFNHSANYRSVAIFGEVKVIEEQHAKLHALKVIMDQMLPGRWEECRLPNEKELKATLVLEIEIEYASAKIRAGGPEDDEDDYLLDLWAGHLPIEQRFLPAVNDSLLKDGIPQPPSVQIYNTE